ncbi:MAG TPA: GNAT family N-acetyltransferase [Rhizomicrobium sp.]|jgi:predicted GNAT family N-acyltransferase
MSEQAEIEHAPKTANLLGEISPGPVPEPGYRDRGGKFTFVRKPAPEDLAAIHALTLREIGESVASKEVMHSVYNHNEEAIWAVFRAEDDSRRDPQLVGYIAYLLLNERGHAALKCDRLDAAAPDLALLARRGERPAALYTWAIIARGMGDLASALVAYAMGLDLHDSVPIYGRVGSVGGLKTIQRKQRSPNSDQAQMGSLFEVKISPAERAALGALKIVPGPKSRTPRPPKHTYRPLVARTSDEVARVFAVRAAVFMAEQKCPYDEEFDGNDQTATHILGCIDGEPAAALRLRYFGGFVKMERLAVLQRFRHSLIAKEIVEYAIALVRQKGFTVIYGNSQLHLLRFWSRFGFNPIAKNTKVVFSDHEYVEVIAEYPPLPDSFTPFSDPMVLIRPEGLWDVPGPLDRSATRPATNPH